MVNFKHGMRDTPTYKTWRKMKARCNNPNEQNYKYYGFKGITYDKEWEQFDNFLYDMGPRPENYTLDRKDGTKNYTKSNCHWITQREQCRTKLSNKLNEQRVKLIRALYKHGWKQISLSKFFKVSRERIHSVCLNKSWVD